MLTRPDPFIIVLLLQFQRGGQIGKFAECVGDLSYIQIACAAVFVPLNNSSIVSFCCFTKISRLEPRLKFKVRGREIGRARQTFQSGGGGGGSISCAFSADVDYSFCIL